MAINCRQLKEEIIDQTLRLFDLYSDNASYLLLLTCATETNLGECILQSDIKYKGGIGIYQMQCQTYNFIWDKIVSNDTKLLSLFKTQLGYYIQPSLFKLATDLSLATIMARFLYLSISEPIPSYNNINAQANYYKKYWNTVSGKNTSEKAEADYIRLCESYIKF